VRHGICTARFVVSEVERSSPLAAPWSVCHSLNCFWFRVARELLLGALFATLLLLLALGSGLASLAWLFGGYVAVYLTLIVTTVSGGDSRSNRLLVRPGMNAPRPPDGASAGRSTPLRLPE
jgi:hypothetical protein